MSPLSSPPTTAESPWPVRTVARKIADWINRLGTVWVEGQLTQISARQGASTAFLTLRDPSADVSLTLTCPAKLLRDNDPQLTDGTRVVVHGKPSFYVGRGTLSLRVDEIRTVGIGELLARIERLRKLLRAEGLFEPERKRPLPFLPERIGLVTGRDSAAEHDVLTNARLRWPAVRFEVRNVVVQGSTAVPQLLEALEELDRDPNVDVIVIARGGGSVEDLLPFSDETLCRAVAACETPVVSAIGHEPDSPLLDHVADVRSSTPTAAGKRVVPDVVEQSQYVDQLRQRARRALRGWVDREQGLLDSLRTRPALADPHTPLRRRSEEVGMLGQRCRRAVLAVLTEQRHELATMRSRLTALGPAATLSRGYAIVQRVEDSGSSVLRSTEQVARGTRLRIRLTDGTVHAVVTDDE
ncbi:exodeoxyribonuclease VII large subunit [Actinopolyspora mortivallis]|uniref:exodeoxyribonuclease VII large subunit n=1 Tax=Actinopolyspora mortivallis TaxID=33906 RepID=UPI000361BA7D|nr:exodeoxyribonuclease VII large subunit [Actinopolyspora mortivallis]